MCPEYLRTGRFSDKIDVYAFGVVLAELLTGKDAIIRSHPNAAASHLTNNIKHLMPSPTSIFPNAELDENAKDWPEENYTTFAQLMRVCLQETSNQRPSMHEVARKLKSLVDGNHRLCIICMRSPPNAKLQCGHAILCSFCSQDVRKRGEGCPICRAPILRMELGLFSKTYIP